MEKRPVIIDTDLTLDDVLAITLGAESNAVNIKAVTVSGENSNVLYKAAQNICTDLGLKCRTGKGAEKSLFSEPYCNGDVYGKYSGFDTILPCCESEKTEYAWDIIYDEAIKAGGKLEIITMGPLTDVAIALLRYPQLKGYIKRIVCAAGSGYCGNAAPYSEYNAYSDPHAAKVVFESGVPVVMCGLDGVKNCIFTVEELRNITLKNELAGKVAQTYIRTDNLHYDGKINIYSAVAMAYLIDENVGTVQDFYVCVETKSRDNKGWTIVDRLGKYKKTPNISVLTDSDKQIFMKIFSEIVK